MRILLLHADQFRYHVTGETSVTKQLDPVPPELMEGATDEVLVCMMAVEKGDAGKLPALAKKTAEEIIEHCKQVDVASVMLYPYAHLSSSLESPRGAVRVMDHVEEQLRKVDGLDVKRAPFGFYKGFEIAVKGHPLSEHGRTITVAEEGEEEVSSAVRAETEKKSEWFILTPQGDLIPAGEFDFAKHPALEQFYAYERGGSRFSEDPPPHIRLMQDHELVDYEPGSDQGNFRWYPKGFLIKQLLEEHISNTMASYGAMQVETPIMYDFSHPALAKYIDKFPARQYVVRSEKSDFFLRFAACFGQFLIKHDANISYRHLPLKLYELTHYSFRREQSGELAGLKRLRAFTMPDLHTLCATIPQAKEEMLNQVDLSYRWMADVEYDYVVGLRAVKEFFEEDSEYAYEIARRARQPVLVELWDQRYFYFITKFETNVVDSQGKAAALSTVQIDVENAAGFDIAYVDTDGDSKHPLMLHTSVSGSIDRNLYAMLEQQAIRMKRSQKARYPFWLAPTQIRLIPVKEHNVEHCERIAVSLPGRVDIDDREETLSKRIRGAEREWIPMIIAVGDREADSDTLPVRFRETGRQEGRTVEEIKAYVAAGLKGKAYRQLNLPQKLSLRPVFRG
jgi:threonyl-tRNA synthetase